MTPPVGIQTGRPDMGYNGPENQVNLKVIE
jgi:hypothetical protein